MASKKSSLKVLDKCVKGPNKVDELACQCCRNSLDLLKAVLSWRKDVQQLWLDNPHSAARRRTAALLVPGYSFVGDNIGWVGRNIL